MTIDGGPVHDDEKTMAPGDENHAMSGSIRIGILAAVLTCACWDGGRAGADRAMQALQSSYETVRADTKTYLPEQAARFEEAFAAVRKTVASGEYMKAVSEARQLTDTVAQLQTVLAARKAELEQRWSELSPRLPAILERLEARVDALSRTRPLPAGVTGEALEAASKALPSLKAAWQAAAAAFTDADLSDAVARGQAVKAEAVRVLTSLGMPVPEILK